MPWLVQGSSLALRPMLCLVKSGLQIDKHILAHLLAFLTLTFSQLPGPLTLPTAVREENICSTDRLAGQLRADAVDGEQGLLTDAEERQEEF